MAAVEVSIQASFPRRCHRVPGTVDQSLLPGRDCLHDAHRSPRPRQRHVTLLPALRPMPGGSSTMRHTMSYIYLLAATAIALAAPARAESRGVPYTEAGLRQMCPLVFEGVVLET